MDLSLPIKMEMLNVTLFVADLRTNADGRRIKR